MKPAGKRYLVLPGYGVTGRGMEASVFQAGTGASLVDALKKRFVDTPVFMADRLFGAAAAIPAAVDLAGHVAHEFQVLSQRFADGPAVVAMTDAARLAFEATYPDLRVLPITRYYLPGLAPRRSRSRPAAAAAAAAIRTAGESAIQADGTVFLDDAKQRALESSATAVSNEGQGVVVGILDTGVDDQHPALRHRVSTSRCLIPNAPPSAGGPADWGLAAAERAGHGTHVAGIVAAEPGHGGPAGVAPRAAMVSYRIFPDNANGPMHAENSVVIDSIRAAIDDGCHIVNLSIEGASLDRVPARGVSP